MVGDLGWGGAALTGKKSGTCSSGGDLGYRVGYTLGIKIWTRVPHIPGTNYGADCFLSYECGTLPQAALSPMTLAPPPPRSCDGTHSTSNLGRPKPVKMLPSSVLLLWEQIPSEPTVPGMLQSPLSVAQEGWALCLPTPPAHSCWPQQEA